MGRRERKDELLLLMALCGEMPADWVGCAAGSDSYGAALLTRLRREGFIKLRSGNGLRGYLLRTKGKRYLLEKYQEDVESFLSGSVSTNHVKSEPEKRLRLHRMGMVWIACHAVGIRIFHSEKPELFPALHPSPSIKGEEGGIKGATYYGTAEWKLETDQEIKGSRACGILSADSVYIVYNTMDSLMKWTQKTERNLKIRISLRLQKSRKGNLGGAILFGAGMEVLERLICSDGGVKGNLFRLDDTYEQLYYIPFAREAALQLFLLCDSEGREKFKRFLSTALKTVGKEPYEQEAGRDGSGRPVYFCYLLELWQLRRIRSGHIREGGRIFCFTYQAKALQELFPESFAIEAIRPEKVYQYLGWDKQREENCYGTDLQDRK